MPTSPALEALYADSPLARAFAEHGTREDQIGRRGASPAAPARAPRNAPVRLTSRTSCPHCRDRCRPGRRRPGVTPALAIQTSTPPHFCDGEVRRRSPLKSASRTSPQNCRLWTGERVGDRLHVPLGPRHQRHPGARPGEGMGEDLAQSPAGAGQHHSLVADVARRREGRGNVDRDPGRVCHVLYRSLQYRTVRHCRAQQPRARAMTRCWISLVPSPISSTFESQ